MKNKCKLFQVFFNILANIKKTIYLRQFLDFMPISYFIQQIFLILDPEVIDEQEN